MEYDKNRALFRDKCNQSWVCRPWHGEHGSSHTDTMCRGASVSQERPSGKA